MSNLNELSLDHNPILLTVQENPIASSPLSSKIHINWNEFSDLLNKQSNDINPNTNRIFNINRTIADFTDNIISKVSQCSYTPKTRNGRVLELLYEIIQVIQNKNKLYRI